MSRRPGRDAEGRPIVAELGRAETPQETADRKAATTRRHRSNQTLLNLVVATLASLGIVAALVLVVVRPDAGPRPAVDYAAVAADAQPAVDVPLVVPALPEGWSANRAELVTGSADGVTSWQIGLLTPAGDYIALLQGLDANPSWISDAVEGSPAAAEVELGGLAWQSHDRRDVEDPGNVAYALVGERDRSTVVLAGTASDAEFATLATAVAEELP